MSQEQTVKILQVPFDMLEKAGYVAEAKRAGVTIRATDRIFAVEGAAAFACIRKIRPRWMRLCGCYVRKDFRKLGYGKALVLHRIDYIQKYTAATVIDTYAFRKKLFLSLGFQEVAGYKIGTTLLRLKTNRGDETE